MKKLKVYSREVLERTRFVKWRYKKVKEITVDYDGKIYRNHSQELNNPRLKVPFELVLETRSKKEVTDFMKKLSRTDSDKWLKDTLKMIQDN